MDKSLLLICGMLALNANFLERFFVYFPSKKIEGTPKEIGLSHEEVTFAAKDRTLHAWWVPHVSPRATILFFHGNAGNISHRLDKIKIFYFLGLSTFIFDYAGYGKSSGSPSESILYEDGKAAYQHLVLQRKIPSRQIIFYGESLGCSLALEVAQKLPIRGIILEAPFLSLKEMAKQHLFLFAPFAGDKYNNEKKIGSILTPKLFIHSRQDETVPFSQSESLFQKAPPPKENLWFETGGHNEAFIIHEEKYIQALKKFILK